MSLFGRAKRSGERTRVFFATDVHGSERCFRKWLNAAASYEADVLILGGDVTGKLLVPVVEAGDDGWFAEIFDERVEAGSPDELADLQKRIRMMGRYDVVVSPDGERALAQDTAVVERTFERVTIESLQRWADLAEARLRDRGVPAYMMLGNDDEPELADVLRASPFVHYAEDQIFELPGGWELLSFGPSTPTPWATPRELEEPEIAHRLATLADAIRDPSKAIYNVHCPPHDTHLDQAPQLDADLRPVVDASGVRIASVGSTAVREAIERHQPVVGLHGHVHESPGATKLRASLCINPGSEYADGILRGAIVDLDSERGLRSWQMIQG